MLVIGPRFLSSLPSPCPLHLYFYSYHSHPRALPSLSPSFRVPSFLKFFHKLFQIVVFAAKALWLIPVNLFSLSSWLASSRLFWKPVGLLFVSYVHIAPLVEACTPVYGSVRGGWYIIRCLQAGTCREGR